MNSNPLVSIGLPTHNRAASIRRAIESALQQDYANIELIISDNASTDSTRQICEEYQRQDKRIRYIRQTVNQGSTPNFQTVLSEAQGDYFMWLADDDWLDDTYISRCLKFLSAHPDYVLACGVAKYYEAGEVVFQERPMNSPQESGAERVKTYFKELDENGAIYGLMPRNQVALIPCQHTLGWDWLFVSTVAYKGKIKTLDDVSIHRSLRGSAKTMEELAASYGWNEIEAKNAFLLLAANVFKEIAWRSPAYNTLKRSARINLGLSCASIIRTNKGLLRLYGRFGILKRVRSLLHLNS